MSRQHIFPRSSILVLGPSSIQSLVPSTLISQAESLLESHRLDDVYLLVDQRRKKLEESIEIDEDDAEELRYVYQRVGFQCFTETLFEDAGKYLFNGELDPRLLISYYPDLRGSLFSSEDAINIFAGVAEHMPMQGSVDDIIMNYSPHLAPSTEEARPTAELRKVLGTAAKEMLMSFLKKTRTRRSLSNESMLDNVDSAIDTVLVKLYVEFERTQDLYALIQSPNNISLAETETILQTAGQYNALCMLYKQAGEEGKLLDTWAKLIEGTWSDPDIADPLSKMTTLLGEKRDKALTQRWGIWLTRLDPEMGLKLLMPKDSGKRRDRPEEDMALLEQISEANPSAGAQFLEYLVLQRRSTSRDLHMRLAVTCVDQVLSHLESEAVSKLWRAKASSYASSPNNSSFLLYFASTTPDSEHKRARLKSILLLAGSPYYDRELIRQRLVQRESVLRFELAIIDGKLGRHKSALQSLVDLGDSASAETYCTLGGEIVAPKVAHSIAAEAGIQEWATIWFGPSPNSKKPNGKSVAEAPLSLRSNSVNEGLKTELLTILLGVYMEAKQSDRAAHLLNAQAINLDVIEVVDLVPSEWPVNMMTSFLSRSFRRTLHISHEGKIKKNIAAGQNLEVKDRTWNVLREEPPFLESEISDDEDDGVEEGNPQSFDEKVLHEKVGLYIPDDVPDFGHNGTKVTSGIMESTELGDDLR